MRMLKEDGDVRLLSNALKLCMENEAKGKNL